MCFSFCGILAAFPCWCQPYSVGCCSSFDGFLSIICYFSVPFGEKSAVYMFSIFITTVHSELRVDGTSSWILLQSVLQMKGLQQMQLNPLSCSVRYFPFWWSLKRHLGQFTREFSGCCKGKRHFPPCLALANASPMLSVRNLQVSKF